MATPLSRSDLESALEFARRRIDKNDAIGHAFRRVAQKGTSGDLLAFASALYDNLRCSEESVTRGDG